MRHATRSPCPVRTCRSVSALRLQGVSKHFGAVLALESLDLAAEPGEIHGFLGPNGSGKTTALRILVGLVRRDGGEAMIGGCDPWSAPQSARRRIGYLPADPRLPTAMSGVQLLDQATRLVDGGCDERARLCSLLDLDDSALRRRVGTYSRGMRQKLAIIATFQHRPDILLCDEPTEGLDPLVQEAFAALLVEQRATGRTVLMSSHVLSEVESMCDRITVVSGGRSIAVGTVSELRRGWPRRVEIELGDAAAFGLAGLTVDTVHGSRMTGSYLGPVDDLVRALANRPLVDLKIEEQPLEVVFRDYYRGRSGS